ncbi:MAG: hypothetical protein WCI57_03065 [Candidatus Berkelbacteria bacterium]
MTKKHRKFRLDILIRYFLVLFVLGLFAVPSLSHAATPTAGDVITTPLYQLLRDDAGLHDFWKQMMAMVNSFVVIVLIAVAFCEILNININTYGIKKILPALVFSVIAANFSWIMCRLFIDWANVLMSRFSENTSIIDPLLKSREVFTINVDANISGSNQAGASILNSSGEISFFQAGMRTLFVWAGAIALYVLTFLLLLRNGMIIFLAVFSPVAFMAMVLPQTKSAFNKWWTTFIQWTFMPTVSVFLLWIGSKVQDMISKNTDPLIGFIIAIGFIYAAVKVPFSMSGAASGIMNKWADLGKKTASFAGKAAYQYSGAKSAVDYNKELIKTKSDVAKTRIANAFKDKTGIGSGLDIQKDKLARAQKRTKAISDDKVGAYIGKRGKFAKPGEMTGRQKRYAMEEIETANREGGTEHANKELMSGISQQGGKLGDKVKSMRTGAQKAIAEMSVFDKDWSSFNDEMKRDLLKGQSVGKDGKPPEDVKTAMETGKWKNGDKLTKEEMKSAQSQVKFLEVYARSLLDGDIRGQEATKAAEDLVEVAAAQRLGIDNIANAAKKAEDLVEAMNAMKLLETKAATTTLTTLENEQLAKHRGDLISSGQNELDLKDSTKWAAIDTELANDSTAKNKIVGEKMDAIKKQFGRKDAAGNLIAGAGGKSDIPEYLQRYLQFDASGNLTGLKEMSKIERSRTTKRVSSKIGGDKTTFTENYGTEALGNILLHGSSDNNISADSTSNYFDGASHLNDATSNEKITGAFESMKSNISRTNANDGDSILAISKTFDILANTKSVKAGSDLAALTEMKALTNRTFGANVITGSTSTAILAQMKSVMSGDVSRGSALHAQGIKTATGQANLERIRKAKLAIATSITNSESLGASKKTGRI